MVKVVRWWLPLGGADGETVHGSLWVLESKYKLLWMVDI
jgi:hypothetical protein